MKYRKGYKYQLAEDYLHVLQFDTGESIELPFIELHGKELLMKRGYAWDGPSGPTWDTESFILGSLPHDALYQLLRMGLISQKWRKASDLEVKIICRSKKRKHRMSKFRAGYVYRALRLFAAGAASPKNIRKVYEVK